MRVLESFRNPPVVNILAQTTPASTFPACYAKADVYGNNAYFNSLCIAGVQVNPGGSIPDPLQVRYIQPPQAVNGNAYALGIIPPVDNNSYYTELDIYENISVLNTPISSGAQLRRICISSDAGGGPFSIYEEWSSTGGSPRGISIQAGGILTLGAGSSPYWQIDTGGVLSPTPTGGSVNLGSTQNPINAEYSYEYHVLSWSNVEQGSFKWVQGNNRTELLAGAAILTSAITSGAAAGQLKMGSSSAAAATAGGGSALPATTLGFLVWALGTSFIKIPYYAN